jgi:two-component system cell cycle response regulator
MTGRVLVVDDIFANVKLLEARLSAEYFDVLTAHSGMEALILLEAERVDVVLLDVMMPAMDGFEVCRRIKSAPRTMHVPVVMVTALDQPSERVRGLEAGADDFLTKPVDDIALITRVKNLARLKTLNDEMLLRMASGAELGLTPEAAGTGAQAEPAGRILLVEDQPRPAQRMAAALAGLHQVDVHADLQNALTQLSEKPCDLLIVSLSLAAGDGLRLCSQVRALDRTRNLPIIMLVQPGDEARLLRGLDMGVNDYLTRPVDRNELLARVRTQMKRKRFADRLRGRLEESVELAAMDALTGLHNRRYMEVHLKTLMDAARANAQPLSVVVIDVDRFKSVNDTHGHDAGDNVLREVARRIQRNTRGVDLACRLGGEEFVIVMPDTGMERARQVGERVRACIAGEDFEIDRGLRVAVTASVGVATLGEDDTFPEMFKRADRALYAAKRGGRNRVVAAAA